MHRVVTVGGGIAGLSAAIALRRVGLEVVVCERAPELREVGAGISLWANAMRSLDRIGAGDAVRSRCRPVSAAIIRDHRGRLIMKIDSQEIEQAEGLPPTAWMIHRAELIDALASLLPAEALRLGRSLDRIGQHGDGVEACFADGSRERGDLIVGADGLNSTVRSLVFDPSPPRYAGYTCWRGVCPASAELWPSGQLSEIWGHGERMGVTSLTGDRVYWWFTANQPEGLIHPDSHALLTERARSWASPSPELIAATSPQAIIQSDIFDRPALRAWHRGCAVLIGDAAHPTTPNLGQGGCVSIEDAAVLARVLAGTGSLVERLGRFQTERLPRTTRLTRESRYFGALGQWRQPLACRVRNTLVGLIPPRRAFGNMRRMAGFDSGEVKARQSPTAIRCV